MSEREDQLELIARMADHPAVKAATEEVRRQRGVYAANLGRHLLASKDPVNQREIDRKAGFWDGAFWALAVLPRVAHKDLQREIEKALAAREEAERSDS